MVMQHIAGQVIECALTICILKLCDVIRAKNGFFQKMDKLIFLPLGGTRVVGNASKHVLTHLCSNISQKIYSFPMFSISQFFEKFMFLPLGVPPTVEDLPTCSSDDVSSDILIHYTVFLCSVHMKGTLGVPLFGAHHTIFLPNCV